MRRAGSARRRELAAHMHESDIEMTKNRRELRQKPRALSNPATGR
jgi:hypothetical protein